jgi:hypothetical protein
VRLEQFAGLEDEISLSDRRLVQRLAELGMSEPQVEELLTLSAATRRALRQVLGE